jgi:hypothetical protein
MTQVERLEVTEQKNTSKQIQSSIDGMSIGTERKCLNQIYRAAKNGTVDANWLLFSGQTAGQFCTEYVVGHYLKRKRREEQKLQKESDAATTCDDKENKEDIAQIVDVDGAPLDEETCTQKPKKARKTSRKSNV